MCIYLAVAVSRALKATNTHKYLAAITRQKCQSQEVNATPTILCALYFTFIKA